ncbi:PH domain-containing protein [Rhizobium sp. 18055]|uniref:PH domain-containing protein n=1 Tax=Rhizobium sp. 18055 TaxID=2681403 RepID=UPI00135A4076|nr:PH domain-containing protein [Rhizobium sp. 18055]
MAAYSLNSKLAHGERVLWSAAPAQGLLLTSRDLLMIPFSAVWLAFAVFWLSMVTHQGAPAFFYLWGAMFVCIGLFFAVGRFAVDAWLRSRTLYAVTDQRVIILRSAPFARFTSIELDRLPELNLIGDGATKGHIRFGSSTSLFGNRSMSGLMPALDPTPQFLGIAKPQVVLDLIRDAGQKARAQA